MEKKCEKTKGFLIWLRINMNCITNEAKKST